jgi:hypothetical protein
MAITGSGKPERIYGTLASSNYFEVLGVRPILAARGGTPDFSAAMPAAEIEIVTGI